MCHKGICVFDAMGTQAVLNRSGKACNRAPFRYVRAFPAALWVCRDTQESRRGPVIRTDQPAIGMK